MLCQQLRDELPDDGGGPDDPLRRLLLLVAVAILLLLIGGVAGAALDRDDPPDDDQLAPPGGRRRNSPCGRRARAVSRAFPPGFAARTAAKASSRVEPASCSRPGPRATRPLPAGAAAAARGRSAARLRLGRDTTVTASFMGAAPDAAILQIEPPSKGAVTSDPAGIACPQTCERAFPRGTQIALTAAAAEGFVFGELVRRLHGKRCVQFLTMTADRTVAASFVPPRPTVAVAVTVTGDGTVTSEPEGASTAERSARRQSRRATRSCSRRRATFAAGEAPRAQGRRASCTLTPQADTSVTAAFSDVG